MLHASRSRANSLNVLSKRTVEYMYLDKLPVVTPSLPIKLTGFARIPRVLYRSESDPEYRPVPPLVVPQYSSKAPADIPL